MEINKCILTGYPFDRTVKIHNPIAPIIDYEFPPVGRVKMSLETYFILKEEGKFDYPILAGICRNAFDSGKETPLINSEFLSHQMKNLKYPQTKKEKAKHLLKYLYDKGGQDLKKFTLSASGDQTIAYTNDHVEFSTIMDFLKSQYYIDWKNQVGHAHNIMVYYDVFLTEDGVSEVEKELPKIPMISLVTQEITTGDIDIDDKIKHAKDLFFQEPQTMDRMRSACEALSYIMEPIRQEIKAYLNHKDVEDFFNLVNNFDIRHNKENTKEIRHLEQLEWIFYSLLNSINTYTKLKNRLGS